MSPTLKSPVFLSTLLLSLGFSSLALARGEFKSQRCYTLSDSHLAAREQIECTRNFVAKSPAVCFQFKPFDPKKNTHLMTFQRRGEPVAVTTLFEHRGSWDPKSQKNTASFIRPRGTRVGHFTDQKVPPLLERIVKEELWDLIRFEGNYDPKTQSEYGLVTFQNRGGPIQHFTYCTKRKR